MYLFHKYYLNWAISRRSLLTISIFLIIFNELFVYIAVRWFVWHGIPCKNPDNCTRILLVADPQILGETFDTNFYKYIAIYDSDRYLANSFRQASTHTRPHVICFLGDLLDEGSVASNEEYDRYTKRFKRIFEPMETGTKMFYIPGDNDIGGEQADIVTKHKVDRFERSFGHRTYLDVQNRTRIINVNLLTHLTPNVTHQTTPSHLNRIIITHISLLSFPGFYSERISNSIWPQVVFSAHLHTSRTLTYPPTHISPFMQNAVAEYDLTDQHQNNDHHHDRKYVEIGVPTCSYRMGVPQIGYGFAVIENNLLRYTVLWLPNRFTIIYSYAAWICIVLILLFVNFRTCSMFSRNSQHQIKSNRIKYNRLIPA